MKKTLLLLASVGTILTACNDEGKDAKETPVEEAVKSDVNEESTKDIVNTEKESKEQTTKETNEESSTKSDVKNEVENKEIANDVIKKYFNGIAAHDLEAVNAVSPITLEDNENTVNYFKTANLSITMGEIVVIDRVNKLGVYQVEVLFESTTEDVTFDKNKSLYEFTINDEKQTVIQRSILETEYLD